MNVFIIVAVIQDMTYNIYIYLCNHNMFMSVFVFNGTSKVGGLLFISMSIIHSIFLAHQS